MIVLLYRSRTLWKGHMTHVLPVIDIISSYHNVYILLVETVVVLVRVPIMLFVLQTAPHGGSVGRGKGMVPSCAHQRKLGWCTVC